ncbi:MAG TPA: alpha/beta hydrolase [Ectothiorhodospiraceae bacterium]|nr:alpha/beta hydrolase [Ectothiorhodospiraceae bacterium]
MVEQIATYEQRIINRFLNRTWGRVMNVTHVMRVVLALLVIGWGSVAGANEVTLKHNGLALNANLLVAEDQTASNRTVLITHGTLAHNRMEIVEALQELLAEEGLNSLAINLSLGIDNRHNSYDCAVPHTYKYSDAVEEISAWVGWLKKGGVEHIIVMGHSRGGNQTAWYAAEHDDPAVKQVVLVAPATWSEQGAATDYKKKYKIDLAEPLKRAREMVANGKGGELMQDIDFIYCSDTQATAEAFVSNYHPDSRRNSPDLFAKIGEPLLVIAGTEDKVVTGLVEQTGKHLGDGNNRLIVIEGADHFFRDLYAEEMVEGLMEFIADH